MSEQSPTSVPAVDGEPSALNGQSEVPETEDQKKKKLDKRRFFGLGKKKDTEADDKSSETSPPGAAAPTVSPDITPKPGGMRAVSPHRPVPIDPRHGPGSPQSMISDAVSPSRIRSSSPRLHSPASSMIFERNVQEHPLPDDLTHSIPSHIQTEDHIPPVLEATSIAITDDHLNPDEVEIVMHSAHQPAVVTIAAAAMSDSGALSPTEDILNGAMPEAMDDNASTYGSIDPTDVRRLSFISFADVVQAEHVEKEKDSVLHMSIASVTNRSPSPPVRSPASSHGGPGPSPPTSGTSSIKGLDLFGKAAATQQQQQSQQSGSRSPPPPAAQGAAGTHSPALSGGELMVETMRQALRRTGSGDLGTKSQPLSAVSLEEQYADQSPFKA